VRTLAVEIESNRRLIRELSDRIVVLEKAQAAKPANVPKVASKAKRSIKKLGHKIAHRKKK
jgi:ABC-type dipeptide/oligopeptide/nickel transport system ATPase subunit